MSKKVIVVGVLNPESTNHHQVKALERLGYNAIGFDYRARTEEVGLEEAMEELKALVEEEAPFLVLFSKLNNWPSSIIEELGKSTLTWWWFMDPLSFVVEDFINHSRAADISSCTGLAQVKYLRGRGVENVHRIFEGVDSEVYYPVDEGQVQGVCAFIGSHTLERQVLVELMEKNDLATVLFGGGWLGGGTITAERFRQVCHGAPIILGADRETTSEEYFSDRVFRVLACKGFYLTTYSHGMERHFENRKHLVYGELDELPELAKYYLEHEDERLAIAEAGHRHVLENFTWDKSMKELTTLAEAAWKVKAKGTEPLRKIVEDIYGYCPSVLTAEELVKRLAKTAFSHKLDAMVSQDRLDGIHMTLEETDIAGIYADFDGPMDAIKQMAKRVKEVDKRIQDSQKDIDGLKEGLNDMTGSRDKYKEKLEEANMEIDKLDKRCNYLESMYLAKLDDSIKMRCTLTKILRRKRFSKPYPREAARICMKGIDE